MAQEVSNTDDLIDSRDVIARIEELEGERESLAEAVTEAEEAVSELAAEGIEESPHGVPPGSPALVAACADLVKAQEALAEWDSSEEAAELAALRALAEEGENYAEDWMHGATLIRESYFEDYARDFADDIGAIKRDMAWPCNHIDWAAAADELKTDYTEIDFGGVPYLVRS